MLHLLHSEPMLHSTARCTSSASMSEGSIVTALRRTETPQKNPQKSVLTDTVATTKMRAGRPRCVFIILCSTYYKAVRVGGRGIVEDM